MVLGVGSWYNTIIVIGVSGKRPNLVGTKLERIYLVPTYVRNQLVHTMVQYGIYHVP